MEKEDAAKADKDKKAADEQAKKDEVISCQKSKDFKKVEKFMKIKRFCVGWTIIFFHFFAFAFFGCFRFRPRRQLMQRVRRLRVCDCGRRIMAMFVAAGFSARARARA